MQQRESETPEDPADAQGQPATRAMASFPIVAIGASAGGLESLELMLRRLRPSAMAMMVMQHSSAHRNSALTRILAQATVLTDRAGGPGRHCAGPGPDPHRPPGCEVGLARGVLRIRKLPDSAHQVRVRCSNGQYYMLRTVPYQTADRSVRGGVIELLPSESPVEEEAEAT